MLLFPVSGLWFQLLKRLIVKTHPFSILFYHIFRVSGVLLQLQTPWVASISVPSSSCYAFNNSSRIVDFVSFIPTRFKLCNFIGHLNFDILWIVNP